MTRALVTGGGGFLGGAIVRALLAEGGAVRSFSRGDYPELRRLGVETSRGDGSDAEAVSRAVQGMDVVFHVAAKAGIWGPYEEYRRANVDATRNVIEACRRHGVPRLVFTGSPSVVGRGEDLAGVDESAPYPPSYKAHYPATKAEAERLVLAANGPPLATVSLRPHLIWGPGDNHILPRMAERARAGRLLAISGPPKLVDTTYIDNAADAHLLAARRLGPGTPCAGKAYFISNGEPLPIWEIIGRLLDAAGAPRPTRSISPRVAYAVGSAFEAVWTLLRLDGEPRMTRFLAEELSTAHWFDLTAARRDLGYAPTVSVEDGLRRLREALSKEAAPA